jgi:hypothetical protein
VDVDPDDFAAEDFEAETGSTILSNTTPPAPAGDAEVASLEEKAVPEEAKVEEATASQAGEVGPAPAAAGSSNGYVYLFLATPVTEMNDMMALMRFVASKHPITGNDLQAALRADHVIVIGTGYTENAVEVRDIEASVNQVTAELRTAGVSFEIITERPAKAFAKY